MNVKKDFPIFNRRVNGKPLVYLDSAATSQKPLQVIEAMKRFLEKSNANIHRGVHTLSEEASLAYEEAHSKVAGFINSYPEEVIFTKNTTESLNLLAYTLTGGLKKGDEILLTQMEHHSNLVPWQHLAKERGLKVRYVEINDDGELKDFSVSRRTKLVSVAHMSNALGTINPVKEMAKQAHENGALVVVDAAQSVPHMPVDTRELGADFLAFSGHKMLGPTGIGVLFGKKELLEKMPPFLFGGGMIKEVSFEGASWAELPWKFEAGTPPIAEAIGLTAAIGYLQSVGMEKIQRHEKVLASYALEKLEELGARIIGTSEKRGGIISFIMEGIHPHDVSTILDEDGIAVRGGHHCAMPLMQALGINGTTRASFYLYNTKEDIDSLAKSVKKARKVFS